MNAPTVTSTKWYYVADKKKVGPVSFEQLQQLVVSGTLKPSDMVLGEGAIQWQPAGTVVIFPVAEASSLCMVDSASGAAACQPQESPAPMARRVVAAVRRLSCRVFRESRLAAAETLAQAGRLFDYGRALWRRRSLNRETTVSLGMLGQRLYESKAGDAHIRAKIALLDETILTTKNSTRPFQTEKVRLFRELAESTLGSPGLPCPEVAAEHANAQESLSTLNAHDQSLLQVRGELMPRGIENRFRIAAGYGTVLTSCVLLVLIVAGGRTPSKESKPSSETATVEEEVNVTGLHQQGVAPPILPDLGSKSNPYDRQIVMPPGIRSVPNEPPAADKPPVTDKPVVVVIVMETSLGNVKIELYPDKAPVTVKNFLDYVDDKFYDGLIFHRVSRDPAVVQGGGYEPGMTQKKTRDPIKNEAGNKLSNKLYTIAMARTAAPDSATAQFYLNVRDNEFLDRVNSPDGVGYCVFGKVIEGHDVVDKIHNVKVGRNDIPEVDVIIKSVRRADPERPQPTRQASPKQVDDDARNRLLREVTSAEQSANRAGNALADAVSKKDDLGADRLARELAQKLETLADVREKYATSLPADDPKRDELLRSAEDTRRYAKRFQPETQLAELMKHPELGQVNRFAYDLMKGQVPPFRIVSDLRKLDFASARSRNKPDETLRLLQGAAEDCRRNGQSSVFAVQAITYALELAAARIND